MAKRKRKQWPQGAWMVVDREVLVDEMEAKNFSMARLARYAGCSKGMVSHLTSGRRTTCKPELAENIAEALGVSLRALFVPQVSTQEGRNVNYKRTRVAA